MYLKSRFIENSSFEKAFQKINHLDFSFFFDCIPSEEEINLNPINIIAHAEPNEYFGHHDWLVQNQHLFNVILTWSDKVLNNCENAIFVPFGSSWITEEISLKPREKVFELGHLCGDKLLTYGHSLRHELFSRKNEIKIPTRFKFKGETILPAALTTKEEIFGDPMFAVVIENTSHNGYFSEKITDCIILKTIPIYWGCSDIDKFYNPEGIISFQSVDQLIQIANNLTPDFYNSKKDVIEENYKRVQEHQNYEQRIADKVTEIFKHNNLI
jgi:hypothetical protein